MRTVYGTTVQTMAEYLTDHYGNGGVFDDSVTFDDNGIGVDRLGRWLLHWHEDGSRTAHKHDRVAIGGVWQDIVAHERGDYR